jgi:hypothetical protein
MLSMHERRGPVEAVALSWRAWWGIKAARLRRGGEVTSIAAGGGGGQVPTRGPRKRGKGGWRMGHVGVGKRATSWRIGPGTGPAR